MPALLLFVSGLLFVGALAAAWFTHGTGVVRDDPARNIAIPATLTIPLKLQVAYNDETVFFRYRWPSPRPGIHHDMLRFDGTKWEVRGNPVPGSAEFGLHEDRVSMLLDDGRVPEFALYGGFVTAGARLAGLTDAISGREVANHPELKRLGQSEPTKYLPATRHDPADFLAVVPEEQQRRLHAAGYFLDLWHWRAARSNPVGVADDQWVAAARLNDSGRAMFATNWDAANNRPARMFDPAKTGGMVAFRWDDLITGRIGQDTVHALTADNAIPFDPNHAWREGDTLPRRLLRAPDGSRADIAVAGRATWRAGEWDVVLRRKLDTGSPDDKPLREGGVYHVAIAVHRDGTGGRWHYVSFPLSVGLGRQADVTALRFSGQEPEWTEPAREVTLFYPGQTTWPLLISAKHAGAAAMQEGIPVRARHSEYQLARYAVETEFAGEIARQWRWTLIAGLLLILGFGIALNGLLARSLRTKEA